MGLRVEGERLQVHARHPCGFRVEGSGFVVRGLESGVWGLRVQGVGCRVGADANAFRFMYTTPVLRLRGQGFGPLWFGFVIRGLE